MRFPWWRRRRDEELEAEIEAHLRMAVGDRMERGETLEHAEAAATREFGNVLQVKEVTRDMWGWTRLEQLLQDVRYALRQMRRSPGFTIVAVLILALGIGANGAIFTLVNSILLSSLPVRDPARLVMFRWSGKNTSNMSFSRSSNNGNTTNVFSSSAYAALRSRTRTMSDVFALSPFGRVNAVVRGQAMLAGGLLVSGNYFSGLGVTAVLGRPIAESDDRPDAPPVAVLSYQFWQKAFAGDRTVIGRTITLNGVPFTVAGVTPREFYGVSAAGYMMMPSVDITVPLSMQEQVERLTAPKSEHGGWYYAQPDVFWLQVMGRLKPAVSAAQTQADATAVLRQVFAEDGFSSLSPPIEPSAMVLPGGQGTDWLRKTNQEPLRILMWVVALVLLIACANLAGLLLARAAARGHEMGVRLALGAARGRLVRQLLTESLILSLSGGAAGVAIAYWGTQTLVKMASVTRPIGMDVHPDAVVLLFCAGLSIVTGLLFGLTPALFASRASAASLQPAAVVGAPAAGWKGCGRWLGRSLVVLQVALTLSLLTGAGLFLRTLVNLKTLDLGFRPDNVMFFALDPKLAGYKQDQLFDFYSRVQDRLESVPGVSSASMSTQALMTDMVSNNSIRVQGPTPWTGRASVDINDVGSRFFETMGIALVLGRDFSPRDNGTAPRVAVINETAARRYFGEAPPLGRRFRWRSRPEGGEMEVVGVVKDAKYARVRSEIHATVYVPYTQYDSPWPLGRMYFEVRTRRDPAAMFAPVRSAVAEVDSNVPLSGMRTQTAQIDEALGQEHFFARLCTFFGALALVLATIGLYGLLAYNVARRTREIGLRVALGAQRGGIAWLVLRETVALAAAGALLGVPIVLAAARLVASFLFGVEPRDPATIAVAAALLLLVAFVAGCLPARRAIQIQPMTALRSE